MRPSCCILYLTDTGYLFPSLVSAMQARRYASPQKADVIVYTFGLNELALKTVEPICRNESIGLIDLPPEAIDGQTAMLARFFLNRFVDQQYKHYIYMDGDTQILGSIDPLIDAEVPEGMFLAAQDPVTFLLEDSGHQSRDLMRHMESLGLTRDQALRYFNSGVLRINRSGWDEIGMAALRHSLANGGPSRFPDQDSLNVVALDRCLPMSLTWNFPIFMRNARVETEINPRIKHFMSNPKPWHASLPPWTAEACAPYVQAIQKYPELTPFVKSMPRVRLALYHLQQRGKRVAELMTWGYSQRRSRILNYEAALPMLVGTANR